jgi:hypothetical protein
LKRKKINLYIIFILFNICYSQSIAEVNQFCNLVSDFYGQPREILPAIIRVESDYVQNSISFKGAFGLMQVTKGAYYDYERILKNPKVKSFDCVKYNWKDNIRVGAWYLFVYLMQIEKHPTKEAITYYFWGSDNPKATDVYFNKVQGRMK